MPRDPAFTKVEAIFNSRTYQDMRRFLMWRREALFQIEPKTTEELWKTWGAIEEVTRQLQGRELYIAYEKAKQENQQKMERLEGLNLERPPWLDNLEGEPV